MEETKQDSTLQSFTQKAKLKLTFWYQKYLQKNLVWKLLGAFLAMGFFGVLFFFLLVRFGALGKLPTTKDLKDIQNYTASEVYSEDGVLLGKYFIENRTNVNYDDISPNIINALVATEDARFFEHEGIDMRAWFRVFFKTVLMRDHSGGGGSTLSQQLAKNLYPREDYRFLEMPINKMREMIIARRLEKIYSKDDLLKLYLNTVPFSRNIYGVQVAAQQFFNTSAKDIKQEEAAVLVGMLKGNTIYDPVNHPERSRKRRNTVLAQMQKYNYLSKAKADSLKALDLIVNYKKENNNEGLATYFRAHIRSELIEKLKALKKPDGSDYNLYTDGLKIYTTIDSKMQSYAELAVKESMSKLQKDFDAHWKGRKIWGSEKIIKDLVKKSDRYKKLKKAGQSEAQIKKNFDTKIPMAVFTWKGEQEKEMSPLDSIKYYFSMLNTGFLAMEPETGKIKAWVGGIDHSHFKYDHVKARRQVGSTFKPIVYARALESGIQPCDYIDNHLVIYSEYDDWKPENSDGKYGGVYSMEGALTKSVNSVAVNLIMRAGVDSVRMLAEQMGITSEIPEVPAIALGAVDVSLYDMIKVYGTLANRGLRPEPIYITKIETADGKELASYDNHPRAFEEVLSSQSADMMIQMMESVVDSGTARRLRYLYKLPNDIAGKTGTTQSQADGWFVGFTPHLVAGAWVGGEYPTVRFRSIRLGQGANTALPIWAKFMQQVNEDSRFKKMQRDTFTGPSEDVARLLDCAPYLDERPLLVEDVFEEINDNVQDGLEKIMNVFKKDKRINKHPNSKYPKAHKKARSNSSKAIRKRNERLKKKRARKKKRKKFFKRLFN
ncbi:MAG TPA: penicillin-binding protein [Saprospiraceae bacterium]|nr:penicillin-binding protein [Saprospiraceae bacterium]